MSEKEEKPITTWPALVDKALTTITWSKYALWTVAACSGALIWVAVKDHQAALAAMSQPLPMIALIVALSLIGFGALLEKLFRMAMERADDIESQRDDCRVELAAAKREREEAREEMHAMRRELKRAKATLYQHGLKFDPSGPMPLDSTL